MAASLLSPPPRPQSQPKLVAAAAAACCCCLLLAAAACCLLLLLLPLLLGDVRAAGTSSRLFIVLSRLPPSPSPRVVRSAETARCDDHDHDSIIDAPSPLQPQPTLVDIAVWKAGTTQSCIRCSQTARRIQYMCDKHNHASILGASSSAVIRKHASGCGCAEVSDNRHCIRRNQNCTPNALPVR